jgi:signal transduction histidine kinase
VPVNFSTSLIIDSEANITGAIEVITDISRMRLLEDEISRTKTLATIGELAAVVAHEIRNPLGGMKGFATLLERDLSDNEKSLAIVQRIHDGIRNLERIVSDLLEAGRDTRLRLEHTDLLLEIERVVDLMGMAAKGEGRNIDFEFISHDDAIYCRIDRGRICQAVTNLLRNASEAVGETGKVLVTVYTRSHNGHVKGTSGHSKSIRDYICIEVTDTGPGVSDEMLEQIFAPFFTTKRMGTGLGLPTVRRIAALHGGEVRYSTVESGGSRFTIEIPRR